MKIEVENIETPVGRLEWIFITGTGKKNLKEEDVYTASVVLESDSILCKDFIKVIEFFWSENKPKGIKKAKSLGFRELKDENENETGFTSFNFWTGTTFQDGGAKIVKVFNSKGAEVSLGSKKIGNESRGRIKGAMGIYANGGEGGVTLFLNGIQLTKFNEFMGGVSFDEVEDGDEGFESFDEDGMDALSEEEQQESVPRL